MDKPEPLPWPESINPLVPTDDLMMALACRAEVCVIALAHDINQANLTTFPFFSHGERLRCFGLAHLLALNIATPQEEEDTP